MGNEMKSSVWILALLATNVCIADNRNSDVFGLLSPNRIDSVQFGHDRDWGFLDAAGTPPTEGCGIRFIEGELLVGETTEDARLLEPMGEFCEVLSPIDLYGSYAVIFRELGGYLWVSKATDVYLWINDEIILVYEPWLDRVSLVDGDQMPCSDVMLGPFGERNRDDERICIRIKSKSDIASREKK